MNRNDFAIIYDRFKAWCCKEAGVNPREWLIDLITKMLYFLRDKNKLEDLLPAIWAKKH